MYLNKVILIGNLTRDPELKALPSGNQVVNFSIATNSVWRDKEGNKKEAVEFHNIVSFGKQAENIAQYMKKGSSLLVEGRLQTQSWEADGIKKYRTEIVADKVQFGPKRDGGASNNYDNQDKGENNAPKPDTVDYPQEEINPDDIPF
ncbi:MAG: single-stranded DNA-binding protein [Candidatus Pacebacteria bacterium]|nr:single-stranded DNA-binding protein [Candidatus Paceibacterota bacterium]